MRRDEDVRFGIGVAGLSYLIACFFIGVTLEVAWLARQDEARLEKIKSEVEKESKEVAKEEFPIRKKIVLMIEDCESIAYTYDEEDGEWTLRFRGGYIEEKEVLFSVDSE